ADWITGIISADQAIKGDLRKLRDRARSLVRDFSYASRFVQSVAENVAGPHGATLQVRVATAEGDFKRSLNDEVEEKWAEWCEDPTVDGGMSFTDVEHLLCETTPQDGCYLVRLVPGYPGNRFRFAIQVLDPDHLEHELNRQAGGGLAEIRNGVEIDAWGRPVAYHLWTVHPSEYGRGVRKLERVPADQIIHQFIRRRPGQTIGVPWFAPVLIDERMLFGFQESAITAARIGAAAPFSLEVADPANAMPEESMPTSYALEVPEPGNGFVPPPGYKVVWNEPTYPNGEVDPFSRVILQSIATGLRVSHLTLTGDLRGANYSSMRAGLMPERDAWRLLFGWFTRGFHDRVYRAWVRTAVLSGALEVPPREIDRVLRSARWQQRGFWSVDPEKEIKARLTRIAASADTLTALCAEHGLDYEEVLRERQREIRLAKEAGVPIDLGVAKAAAPSPAGDSNDDTEDAGGAQGASDAASDAGDRAGQLRLARRHH
ncbi:MAG: phage portal protein, partial [Kofleriaceae bacterium]